MIDRGPKPGSRSRPETSRGGSSSGVLIAVTRCARVAPVNRPALPRRVCRRCVSEASPSAGSRRPAHAARRRHDAVMSRRVVQIRPALGKPSQTRSPRRSQDTWARGRSRNADSGRRVVERQLTGWGADTMGFAVRDGSGLSRHNYLSPETIMRVLDVMRRHPSFAVFYGALPVAGVDGTLRSRMKGTPAEGNVHAKTGTIERLARSPLCHDGGRPSPAVQSRRETTLPSGRATSIESSTGFSRDSPARR